MSYRWCFQASNWDPIRSELGLLSAIIQPEEKARIARFIFKKDAKSSLIGRLLIRKLVNVKTGTPNDLIKLARDEHNKPILISPNVKFDELNSSDGWATGPQILNFNVSHQGNYVVLASDPAAIQVGIDVMNVCKPGRIATSVDEYFRLMNHQFTANEWKQIRASPGTSNEKQMANFTRFWCLKESYVKAVGVGIVFDLRSIEFDTKSELSETNVATDTTVTVDGVLEQNWNFEERFLDNSHIVTVARQMKEEIYGTSELRNVPDFQDISLNFLLENMNARGEEDGDWVEEFLTKK